MASWTPFRCPDDGGKLLDWPSERYGFMCPNEIHGGNGRFFTTAEAETPLPAPELASGADKAAGHQPRWEGAGT